MSSSPESPAFQEQVRQELLAHYDTYSASDDARLNVAGKTFTGVSGPFGIGKSTIVDEVLRIEPSIHPIHTTTTRHRKLEDPAGFKTADEGVTFASMRDAIRNGEVVNYSIIPHSDIYGTFPEDFPATHTIGPFMPSSMDQISNAGFEAYNFVYVVAAGELWRSFIEKSRRSLPMNTFNSRVEEALDSIELALDNPELLFFVENKEGEDGVRQAAETIAHIALNQTATTLDSRRAEVYLQQMRTVAHDLVAKG